jgi:hypothetical protein
MDIGCEDQASISDNILNESTPNNLDKLRAGQRIPDKGAHQSPMQSKIGI